MWSRCRRQKNNAQKKVVPKWSHTKTDKLVIENEYLPPPSVETATRHMTSVSSQYTYHRPVWCHTLQRLFSRVTNRYPPSFKISPLPSNDTKLLLDFPCRKCHPTPQEWQHQQEDKKLYRSCLHQVGHWSLTTVLDLSNMGTINNVMAHATFHSWLLSNPITLDAPCTYSTSRPDRPQLRNPFETGLVP